MGAEADLKALRDILDHALAVKVIPPEVEASVSAEDGPRVGKLLKWFRTLLQLDAKVSSLTATCDRLTRENAALRAPTSPSLASAPQPPPLPATGDLWGDLIAELPAGSPLRPLFEARRQFGIAKYGVPVQRGNGRNFAADALQEALDLLVYLRGANLPDMEGPVLSMIRQLADVAADPTRNLLTTEQP